MTRRDALRLPLAAVLGQIYGQNPPKYGIASRNLRSTAPGTPSDRPYGARFVNVAAEAGLHRPPIHGGPDHADYVVESLGCGVAFLDYDNDGWLDILLPNVSRFGAKTPNPTIQLYQNDRHGGFTDVTERSGLGRSVWATGVTVADYDNDGFDDIFITCWGQNLLFHNNGDGTFSDVTKRAGLLRSGTHLATGCTWLDYDRNGNLDLFVSHYAVFDPAKTPIRGKDPACNYNGIPVFCGPAGLPQESSRLYRNNGNGTFTDVSEASGIASVQPGYSLTAVAADFDGDGWPDIYVACDTSPSLYFHNNQNGTFTEQGLERGVSLSDDGKVQAGMGIGIGDYDANGGLDIFKTHFRGDTNVLYRNDGKGNFRDDTLRAGLGVETRYVGWGAAIADFDNDGWPDLFYCTGMVYPEVEAKIPDAPYKTSNVLFRNLGDGRFEELTSGLGSGMNEKHSSRGAAFGDFDNDGDIDIVIVNMNGSPSLLRNDIVGTGNVGTGNWLKVLLTGINSNRSAIGASVLATFGSRRQRQAVTAQGSYLSVNDRRLHFGLGTANTADLEIRWPNGSVERVDKLDSGYLHMIHEGAGVTKKTRF